MNTSHSFTRVLAVLLLGLSMVGLVDTVLIEFNKLGNAWGCGEGSGCATVLAGEYSIFLGVPLSLLGSVTYTFLFVNATAFLIWERRVFFVIHSIVVLVGALFSLYLIALQAWVIEAWCQYCLISAGVQWFSLLVTLLALRFFRGNKTHFSTGETLFTGALYVSLAIVVSSYLYSYKTLWVHEPLKEPIATIENEAYDDTHLGTPYLVQTHELQVQQWTLKRDWYESHLLTRILEEKGISNYGEYREVAYAETYEPIDEAMLKDFYDNRYLASDGVRETYEAVRADIENYILEERQLALRLALLKEAEKKYDAQFKLEKPIAPVLSFEYDKDSYPLLGRVDAPVSIVVFSDLQCSFCKEAHERLKAIFSAYPDTVRLVFRHFPLETYTWSEQAALASLAAWRQGRFWDYVEQLYSAPELSTEFFLELAASMQLDLETFEEDLSSELLRVHLDSDVGEAYQLNVKRTPTIYINGRLTNRLPTVDDIERLLANEEVVGLNRS